MDLKSGAYTVIGGDFEAADADFEDFYDKAVLQWKKTSPQLRKAAKPSDSESIVIGDSGFFTADQYFRSRTGASESVDFTGGYTLPRLTRGTPVTTGVHGSHVASIAGFGTTRIKLIDVQICSNQESGPQGPVWANALTWAVSQRPAVINCSVNVPWEQAAIQAVVSRNTSVLFVATAGNTDTSYDDDYKNKMGLSFSSGNLIMVGGCGKDGEKIPNRGSGSAVNIYAPSVDIPGRADETLQRLKFEYDQSRKEAARQAEIQTELRQNEEALRIARAELAEKKGMEKALLENKIRAMSKPKAMAPYQRPPFLATALSDSGASFALPMISNVAAKMKLINPSLTPANLIRLLTEAGDFSATLGGLVMQPVAAYQAALDSRHGT